MIRAEKKGTPQMHTLQCRHTLTNTFIHYAPTIWRACLAKLNHFFIVFVFGFDSTREVRAVFIKCMCVCVCTGHTLSALEACKYLSVVFVVQRGGTKCVFFFFLQQRENNVRPTTTETTPRRHATQAGRANQTILRQRTRAGRRAKTKVSRKGGGQGAYTRPYQPR